jgi:hypothetical protein
MDVFSGAESGFWTCRVRKLVALGDASTLPANFKALGPAALDDESYHRSTFFHNRLR